MLLRAVAIMGLVLALVAMLGATPVDVTVSPNTPNGCVAIFPAIDCPSSPFLLSVLRPGLTINFNVPDSSSQNITGLDSLTVSLALADNPGLFGKQYDAASEAGSVYLVIGSSQYLLGSFGGGTQGLNAHPNGQPLGFTGSVAPADIASVFAGLKSTGFAFAVKVSRTDGDFNVIDAAGASVDMETMPEPATVGLFGIGLAGLWALRRRSS